MNNFDIVITNQCDNYLHSSEGLLIAIWDEDSDNWILGLEYKDLTIEFGDFPVAYTRDEIHSMQDAN